MAMLRFLHTITDAEVNLMPQAKEISVRQQQKELLRKEVAEERRFLSARFDQIQEQHERDLKASVERTRMDEARLSIEKRKLELKKEEAKREGGRSHASLAWRRRSTVLSTPTWSPRGRGNTAWSYVIPGSGRMPGSTYMC